MYLFIKRQSSIFSSYVFYKTRRKQLPLFHTTNCNCWLYYELFFRLQLTLILHMAEYNVRVKIHQKFINFQEFRIIKIFKLCICKVLNNFVYLVYGFRIIQSKNRSVKWIVHFWTEKQYKSVIKFTSRIFQENKE